MMEDQTSYLITVQFALMAAEFICCIVLAVLALYALKLKDQAEERLHGPQPIPDTMPGNSLSDEDRFALEQFVKEL